MSSEFDFRARVDYHRARLEQVMVGIYRPRWIKPGSRERRLAFVRALAEKEEYERAKRYGRTWSPDDHGYDAAELYGRRWPLDQCDAEAE